MSNLNLILAMDLGRCIGFSGQNKLAWNLPSELKEFKRITMGGILIMGYNTYVSLGSKPLPGRQTIVITRKHRNEALASIDDKNPIFIADSLDRALKIANEICEDREIFIAGGAEVYNNAIQNLEIDRYYITVVQTYIRGDAIVEVPNFHSLEFENTRTFEKTEKDDYNFVMLVAKPRNKE
jgi:dihydrofolate reductase